MRLTKLHSVLIGAGIAIVGIGPLGAFLFIKSGVYDVAASRPHTTLTEWITHETMIHSVKRRAAAIEAPRHVSGGQVLADFCTYETHCVACHGVWVNTSMRLSSGSRKYTDQVLACDTGSGLA